MARHESRSTTNHDEIKHWVEERGGKPTTVEGTHSGESAGLLRIKFAGGSDELEEISWDDFFEKFDESNLAMLFQEETKDEETSRFFKFVDRGSAQQSQSV